MRRFRLGVTLALALVVTSGMGTGAHAAVNLLANPGFEDAGGSYNGWFTFGSGPQLSLPAGDNIIRTGAAASKIFGEFTGCPGVGTFTVGGYGQAFTPTAGTQYTFSGYSFVSVADTIPGNDSCTGNRAIAKVVFFDAAVGGLEISSNEIIIGDHATPRDQWIPFSVTAPVPPGALRVEALILFLQPGCDAGAVYVDDTSFCEEPITPEANLLANPSFDTGLTGWSTFGNVFHDTRSFAVHTPTGSAKLFGTFVPNNDSGMFQTLVATPGTSYKFDVSALTTCIEDPINGTNDNLMLAKLVFRDSTATEITSVQTVLVDNTSPLGTWTRHSVQGTAPAGTVTMDAFILFVGPSLLSGAAWVDDALVRALTTSDAPHAPQAFELRQNVPNPFNPATRIDFVLRQADDVSLRVYDVAGRLVTTLLRGHLEPGDHFAEWNGRDANGAPAAAGVYRYVLDTSAGRVSRSMVLVK